MKRCLIAAILAVLVSTAATASDDAPFDLKAHWIWQAEEGPSNSWVAFRKTVDVDEIPKQVVANISADSKYWLWINGELVVFEGSVARGPSPAKPWNRVKEMWTLPPEAKPSNTWYEEVDITGHLKAGENTIAVLVWYWGNETHKGTHIDSGKGGFIFQADIGGQLLTTDQTWKVKAHPAYDRDSGATGKNIVQFNVKYDARKSMGDWTMPGYSDSDWKSATEKGKPPTAPWFNLEKHYVPPLVNHGLKFYSNYPESTFPFVSTGETITCKLPFNQQITPYLEVESGSGLTIEITTDNRLNAIRGIYTTQSGKQAFESYSWMNGHEVRYSIPEGVKVLSLKYRWMSVGEMAGSFSCSDPFYERLWRMGRDTLFVCARDNFMDCPDRERACWIGDVADQAGYLFYCMDDPGRQLLKKAIRTTMAYSHEGVYGALGPLRLRELPSQSLQFVDMGVWQYYLNTGDKETLNFAYPYIKAYLKLWEIGPDGLPIRENRSMDSWNWCDWGKKETVDQEVILDSLYYMALNSAKKMALELGETNDIAWYDDRIQTIKPAFNKRYWTSGGFYSTRAKQFRDDRANCLAILAGLADAEKYDAIVQNVLIPNQYCSPHFEWMVEEALCKADCVDAALLRMKERYQPQVDQKWLSTLYEMFPRGGSYNHAWNAPNTILSKYVAGIAPTKPGWSEYQVMPNMAHLTSLRKLVPSVKGPIALELSSEEKGYRINLQSPAETVALVGVPKSIGRIHEIQINGNAVWEGGTFSTDVIGVTAAGQDDDYIIFRVQPGDWTITAKAD